MNADAARLEYDAETRRTQRKRKGLIFFLGPHHVRHDMDGPGNNSNATQDESLLVIRHLFPDAHSWPHLIAGFWQPND
jgi:hypothetical protein